MSKNTSYTVGSLVTFIVNGDEWSSDLAGIVVAISQKMDRPNTAWGNPVEFVKFTGKETVSEALQMLATALVASDSRSIRGVVSTTKNPEFDAQGRMVEGSGTKVSGRWMFTPDPTVKSQHNAMRLYARAIGDIADDASMTFGSAKQAGDFVTISREGAMKGMGDKVLERFSFRWSHYPEKSNESRIAGLSQ